MHFDIRKDTEQTSKTIFTCAYLIYHKDVGIRLKTVQSKSNTKCCLVEIHQSWKHELFHIIIE